MSIMLSSLLQGRITNYYGISKMGEINLSVIIRNDTKYVFFLFFFLSQGFVSPSLWLIL